MAETLEDKEVEEAEESTDEEVVDTSEQEDIDSLKALVEQYKADSELLQEILEIPTVREAILKEQEEEAGNKEGDVAKVEKVDTNDPIAVLRSLIREEVGSIVDSKLNSYLEPLLSDRATASLRAEYEALVKSDPRVASIGFDKIVETMERHPTLNMYQASRIAVSDDVLKMPRAAKKPPAVASSGMRGSTQEEIATEVSRLRKLQEDAQKARSSRFNIRELIAKKLGG